MKGKWVRLKRELARFAYDYQNEIAHAEDFLQIQEYAEKYVKENFSPTKEGSGEEHD